MAQATRISEGGLIDYVPGSDVSAGQVVIFGGVVGIANVDIPSGRLGALSVDGVFNVAKITGAISKGDRLFFDPTGDPVGGSAGTGAATTNPGKPFMGVATRDAAETDTTVQLRLQQTGSPAGLSSLVTDPGNGGAIPVISSGSVQLVTTGAQTRTLAVPTFVGQQLVLSLKTDGGDCVVTAAAAVNQTGNNTLTFNDVGDTLVLVAVESGSNKRWRVVSNDGVTLSTV